MISAMQPVCATIIARFYLNEACGPFEIINVFMALIGITIVLQPPFIFGSDTGLVYGEDHFFAASIALTGVFFGGLGAVMSRSLRVT